MVQLQGKMMKQMLFYFLYWSLDILFCLSDSETKKLITEDAKRYAKWNKFNVNSIVQQLNCCLRIQPFRSQLFYRFSRSKRKVVRYISRCLQVFIRPCKSVEIDAGLLISHNHSVIHPWKAGINLRVGPGVVIGQNKNRYPVIGDNVYIAANSLVIGGISIGDNVIVGAGSVVLKDVESNVVVAGNPARVIRNITTSDELELF